MYLTPAMYVFVLDLWQTLICFPCVQKEQLLSVLMFEITSGLEYWSKKKLSIFWNLDSCLFAHQLLCIMLLLIFFFSLERAIMPGFERNSFERINSLATGVSHELWWFSVKQHIWCGCDGACFQMSCTINIAFQFFYWRRYPILVFGLALDAPDDLRFYQPYTNYCFCVFPYIYWMWKFKSVFGYVFQIHIQGNFNIKN